MIATSRPVQSTNDASGVLPAASCPTTTTAQEAKISRLTKIKLIGSLLIVLHLIAIVLAPASVPPASRSVQTAWSWVRPYLQFAYLNHGYHYFAPDPGPSSLIEYTVITEDGERIWGRIPDREKIWPRLRYHRYFMLTEFYGAQPPTAEELRQAVAQSYAQQLMQNHDGVSVELSHVVHRLSTREEMIAGGRLDEPHKYQFTPLGTFSIQDEVNVPDLTSDDQQPETPQAESIASAVPVPPAADTTPADPTPVVPPTASDPIDEAPPVE